MARIVFVTSRLPYPPSEGHQLRSWNLLRAAAGAHSVSLLSCQRVDDAPERCGPLRDILSKLEYYPIPAERSRFALLRSAALGMLTPTPFVVYKYLYLQLRQRLAALATDADLVHFDMLPLAALADQVPAGIPIVLNEHNVEHSLLERRIEIETNWLRRAFLRQQVSRLRRFERDACECADAVLACSQADAALLARLAPGARIDVVANGVDVDNIQPATDIGVDPDRLVFVGQMGWFPNRDGVDYFLDAIFPRVVSARPSTHFVIVGKSTGLEITPALKANVTLTGFVPDVRPPVQAAAVYVVPLRVGSGTRLKVLEAMAMGKAIVTTTIGAEGIALNHERDALFADTPEEFAAAIVRLLDDPQLAQRLGSAARDLAQTHYGWQAIGENLLAVYQSLLQRKLAAR